MVRGPRPCSLSGAPCGCARLGCTCLLCSRARPAEAQLARTRIAGCLAKSKPPPTNLSPEEQKAIKALREAEDIVIAPADKGNATVVMDQTAYDGKIRALLVDTNTYKRLTRDPTQALERRMNAVLLSLSRAGAIPGPLYEQLRSSAGRGSSLLSCATVRIVRTPKGSQTWDPPTANCVLHQLPYVPVVKAPRLYPVATGWEVRLPREELSRVCLLHCRSTPPQWNSVGVIRCSVTVHKCPS